MLVYRACCEGGRPLPRWLKFDAWNQAFVGTLPTRVELLELRVIVIASDLDGLKAYSAFSIRRKLADEPTVTPALLVQPEHG